MTAKGEKAAQAPEAPLPRSPPSKGTKGLAACNHTHLPLALALSVTAGLGLSLCGQTGCGQLWQRQASHTAIESPSRGFRRTQNAWLPFLWFLVRGGSMRYTRTAVLPLFRLWSFTSSMSGREFMAQRKFAFHVLGSGSFSPALYRPGEQSALDHQLPPWLGRKQAKGTLDPYTD